MTAVPRRGTIAASQTASPSTGSSSRVASCLTCRKRQVKCDRITPRCGPCDRLSLGCLSVPEAQRLLWLPVNQIDPNAETGQDQVLLGQDFSVSGGPRIERFRQARRRALYTEKERISMSQQLLQSIGHMDLNDILETMDNSTETGAEAAVIGPFSMFTSHQTIDDLATLAPSSDFRVDTTIASTPIDFNLDSLFTPEEIDVLNRQLNCIPNLINSQHFHEALPQAETSRITDIANSNFGADYFYTYWDNLSAGSQATAPDTEFSLLFSGSPTLELQPAVESLQLPSPTSLHLPFLQPSQVLERVPKDTFTLLEYHGSKMLFFLSPLPSQKPPWKIMHHPTVLETTAALLTVEPVKHAQVALLYSILSICAFHIDWRATFESQAGNYTTSNLGTSRSYWWNVGEQFQNIAKERLQLALRGEFSGPSKAKYKHILMTLLCMVTICVLTGNMENGKYFLLDAERAIRLRGHKPHVSKKVRLLHNIFLYNRIIEDSTSVDPEMNSTGPDIAAKSSAGLTLPTSNTINSEPTTSIAEGTILQSASHLGENGSDRSISKKLLESDGALFEEIYGIPITLMDLMAQVTALASDVDSQESSTRSPHFDTAKSFASHARSLEDRICGFRWECDQDGFTRALVAETPPSTHQSDCLASKIPSRRDLMRPLVTAMHQALLIFFYTRIRKLNPYALQPFVKRTIYELFAFQRIKEENQVVTPVPCWPGFIAGCEALEEEERHQFRLWFRQCGRGWRSFDTIGDIVERFWKARDAGNTGSRSAGQVTWELFAKQHCIAMIPT